MATISKNPQISSLAESKYNLLSPFSKGDAKHFVLFYEDEEVLVDEVSTFIGDGLQMGDGCIVLAREQFKESLEQRLQENGLDIVAARQCGQYFAIGATMALPLFMVDGLPDAGRFAEVVGNLITQAARGGHRVRIFGNLVAVLWAEGNQEAAICLEDRWNDLAQSYPFTLFCAYPLHFFGGVAHEKQFSRICTQHSQVLPTESYTSLTGPDEHMQAIALLQQKAISLEIELARQQAAKELEQYKDRFISMASHELKTPLTSITGFLNLLQRQLASYENEKVHRYLARMNAQVHELTKLVNDLLDLSKIQIGHLSYCEERFTLDALVQQVIEDVQQTTQTHRLLLGGQTSVEIVGDRERLGQALTNLLNNAIKYSPQADMVIVQLAKNHDHVLMSIQDFGIGIAREDQQKIFERFYQINDANVRASRPGLGIGLSLVREIVEYHHGQLWVESEKGKGSTFHISLPLVQG
jgi:signal transduction histidine kinase